MILEEIKFLFQKLFSAKYKIVGKCKQCGKCCREITFMNGNVYISTEEQFEAMKRFDKSYRNFEISGFDDNRKILLFKCKALSDDNKCTQYWNRSLICRLYPFPNKKFLVNGGQLLDGCGFSITKTKNFKDFLNSEKIK